MFAIVDLSTNELVGVCGLCYIDWINRNADFLIYIGKDSLYIDEVYAVDVAGVVMKCGFEELNLHRMWKKYTILMRKNRRCVRRLDFLLRET